MATLGTQDTGGRQLHSDRVVLINADCGAVSHKD